MEMLAKKVTLKSKFIPLALLILGLLLALFIPFNTSSYMLRVINIGMITFLVVLGVYVLLGMTGQNSFAQAGLWGLGAYTTANILLKTNASFITAFFISIIGTALFAFLVGLAFFRLREFYFTFATIGLMTILNGIFMNWTEVTGGGLGISNIPKLSIGSFVADTEVNMFFVIFIVCILSSFLVRVLYKSAIGRSFMAIRDNELAANSLGINSLITKSIAFAISGALSGAAGALYATLAGYLSYQSFTFQQSTNYLIMIMLGGTLNPAGALIGTSIITLLQEWVRPLQNHMQLIFGAGIILLMIIQPGGILGGVKLFYGKYIKNSKSNTETEKHQ